MRAELAIAIGTNAVGQRDPVQARQSIRHAYVSCSGDPGLDLGQIELFVRENCRSFGYRPFDARGRDLRGFDFSGADLRGTNLSNANLEGASLNGAQMLGVRYNVHTRWPAGFDIRQEAPTRRMVRVEMASDGVPSWVAQRALFGTIDVSGFHGTLVPDLARQNLDGIDLHGGWLRGARLTGASLKGTRPVRAYLIGANLSGADLRGADLREAVLGNANFSGAWHDATTRWPEGFWPAGR